MKKSDFAFDLPSELIAQQPVTGERDESRLMVLDKADNTIAHRHFFELPDLLKKGDLLVFNDSKVMPARLQGIKDDTKGKTELLLLRPRPELDLSGGGEAWEAMIGSRRTRAGQGIIFKSDSNQLELKARILERLSNDTWLVEFNQAGDVLHSSIDKIGLTPIPPYIKESPLNENELRTKYQTVYAQHEGSAAAPTAGLHFSERLLEQLKTTGIETATVTLHVGLGTFAPMRSEDTTDHKMHEEYAIVSDEAASAVNKAKASGRRVIAVGTTSARTLESFMVRGQLKAGQQWTDIFITPGYDFQAIDAMITNFHLPESTLLMMVSAFAGTDLLKTAYKEAVAKKYRFYSFGDGMLIQ